MFTGIIRAQGVVCSFDAVDDGGVTGLKGTRTADITVAKTTGISTPLTMSLTIDVTELLRVCHGAETLQIGDSIAVNGVCLTAIDITKDVSGNTACKTLVRFDIASETVRKTTIRFFKEGQRVNLELSLAVGDHLGGHFVLGHVDVLGMLVHKQREGETLKLEFIAPLEYRKYLVAKGSVAIDGISLTIGEVRVVDRAGESSTQFAVYIIPHTANETNLGSLAIGDSVNLEIDPLARYAVNYLQCMNEQ